MNYLIRFILFFVLTWGGITVYPYIVDFYFEGWQGTEIIIAIATAVMCVATYFIYENIDVSTNTKS